MKRDEQLLIEARKMSATNIKIALGHRSGLHAWAVRVYEQALQEKESTMYLVDVDTNERVLLPAVRKNFRGDEDTVISISKAPGNGSSGKVQTKSGREVYPSVFGLKIMPTTTEAERRAFEDAENAGIDAAENE